MAWKDKPTDDDASAKVFVCDRIEDKGPITWFYIGNDKKSFSKDQFFSCARLTPSVPTELTNQEQLDLLKYHFERLGGFAKRYPNSSQILTPLVATLRKMIGKYQGGQTYSYGTWTPRKDGGANLPKSNLPKPSLPNAKLAPRWLHPGAAQPPGARPQDSSPEAAQLVELKRLEALETQRLEALASKLADARKLAYATVGGIAIYLTFLIGAIVRGARKSALLLLLLPCLAAGWLTYQEGGTDWTSKLLKHLTELPANMKPPADTPPP